MQQIEQNAKCTVTTWILWTVGVKCQPHDLPHKRCLHVKEAVQITTSRV